ncbi:MAG TPA: nuclear transport factor 2 family protein [Gemmatimonadales bacterium]|nr:nuclear transport factor 2 family protein [Gemmatimonadales bacterium]
MRTPRPALAALVTLLSLGLPRVAGAQAGVAISPDAEGVTRAARDYLEGFYEGDSTKIVRSISPTVVKYGYYVPKGDSTYHGEAMTFAEMLDYVRRVKARGRPVPADAPRTVVALEVLDQVAAAKVVAWWGTDFLHLARIDGRWMITQVIWQSPPKTGP